MPTFPEMLGKNSRSASHGLKPPRLCYAGHMSLRGRVIGLVGLVLVVSLSLYLVVAWGSARSDLAAELGAARTSGILTTRSSFELLPRSKDPEHDLRQLVATFDGNRHLRAVVLDRARHPLYASAVALPRDPAPRWFAALLGADLSPTLLPVPNGGGALLMLRPEPASDIAALWSASASAAALFGGAVLLGLALIYWVIGRALAPLNDLAQGFGKVGARGYRERVREVGPPELLTLQRGFNAMADRLAETAERNRALEAQLLTIQDEERAEIARDLHDEIGPHLFAVALDTEMIARAVATGEGQAIPEQIRSIQSAVSYMQRQVRELIARLRPTRASELGLEPALHDLIAFWQARQPEVTFTAELAGADGFVPEGLRDVIYRLAQEAVANALRHADTTELAIALTAGNGGVRVQVANRGAPRPLEPKTPGFGLASMRERVDAAGGVLRIDRSERGWTVAAEFPATAGSREQRA